MGHFSPSTVVQAPSPSTTMRTALGVWRWLGAHSPGMSSCMPRYMAALACIFSSVWPGLANTSTRRSAFSMGVSSPAFSNSGLMVL
ncbi:hypothetical protein FQZ97_889690 [compost metagenome]